MRQGTGHYGRPSAGRPMNVRAYRHGPIMDGIAPYEIRVRCGCGCGYTAHNCRDWQGRARRAGHAAAVERTPATAMPRGLTVVDCRCGFSESAEGEPGALRAWRDHAAAMLRREGAAS